jgi:hypothetical protein
MTPDQLAKSGTEHGEQRALFQWLKVAEQHGFAYAWAFADEGPRAFEGSPKVGVPQLARCFAVPNGGERDKITAAKLKHEGVKRGVPDIFLPLPCPQFAGLFIEMKRSADKATKRRAGTTSNEQDDWIAYLRSVGYACSVCYDWRTAARDIQSYVEMALGRNPQ